MTDGSAIKLPVDMLNRLSPRSCLAFGLALFILILGACQLPLRIDRKGKDGDTAVNLEQIRLRMRSLVDPMTGQIEATADMIGERWPDRKRATIQWKLEAVPALREALYQPTPVIAITDAWALLFQMADYFDTGAGAAAFGEAAPIARDTCLEMEVAFAGAIAEMTVSGEAKGREICRAFAIEHPITTSIAHRESTLGRIVRADLPDELSATEVVGDITNTLDDLNRRLEVYSDQMVKQAQWTAELALQDISEELALKQAVPTATQIAGSVGAIDASVAAIDKDVDHLAQSLHDSSIALGSLPNLIAEERAMAIKTAQEEITRTMEFFSKEIAQALKHLTEERVAAIEAVQATIALERRMVIDESKDFGPKIVDHAFLRAAQLGGAALVALALLAWIVLARLGSLVRQLPKG